MPATIQILAIFLCLSLLPSSTISHEAPLHIKGWCSQTPYPIPCEYLVANLPPSTIPAKKSNLKKLAVQLALDRAVKAHSQAKLLGYKRRNELERAAWADCIELYETTILQLNRTLDPNANCTDVDRQTWLSSALTNLETCWMGFVELGVSDEMLPPLKSNNVSKLICNSLALNKPNQTYEGGYPSWVKAGDRKLLQAKASPASQANIVVAKDGSGNFKTIKEAVGAAVAGSGRRRFVIYVKAGVYQENIDLGISLNNIMFVGDGIGKTIVTGSRSVGGGSTTFKSATFGKRTNRYI